MRVPKELAAVAAAAVLSVSLAGCGQPASSTEQQPAQETQSAPKAAVSSPVIKKDGVLRVAVLTSAGTPEVVPPNASDSTSGGSNPSSDGSQSYSGLDVDVASALAKQMGLTVELVPVSSVEEAKAAGVDVVLGVTSETADGLTLVSSYMEQAVGIFGRGDDVQIARASELDGKTVAVANASAAAAALAGDSSLSVTVRDYPSVEEAFKAMATGETDYAACDAYEGGYLTTQNPGTVFCGTVDVPRSVGAGVATGSTALVSAVQDALDAVSNNGVLGVVRSRWVGSMPALGSDTQVGSSASTASKGSSTAQGSAGSSSAAATDSSQATGASSSPNEGAGTSSAQGSDAGSTSAGDSSQSGPSSSGTVSIPQSSQAITGDGSSAGSNAVTSVD